MGVKNTTTNDFNSHAHVERDDFKDFEQFYSYISTHTLTWSVTSFSVNFELSKRYFNSHAHVERDKNGRVQTAFLCNFNSHAHVERDKNGFKNKTMGLISTHTLTWSVTSCVIVILDKNEFQLTRSRGA